MDDQQLLRYSRHILLPEIGIEGQQRLRDASALIIGLGGLGSPVAMYLAAAGVGQLILVDDDQVELSNLQRQIAHTQNTLGQNKVDSAQQSLATLNPDCAVTTIPQRLNQAEMAEQIAQVDLVLDCSDNFDTRFLINRLCHAHQTPLVSGAAIRWDGQLAVFAYQAGDACYHCLYGHGEDEAERCSENGVAAPLVGVIGSLQALEALKLLSGAAPIQSSPLHIFDGLQQQWRTLKLRRDPHCPVCG